MAYTDALAVGANNNVDATLIIDGIPVLFGTKAGLTLTTTSLFVTATPSAMTSVDAFAAGSLSVDGGKLDYDTLVVSPGAASVSIRGSSDWNKYFERRRTPQTRLTSTASATATSLSASSTTGFSNGDVVYVDRETILAGTVFSSVTREYCTLYGSRKARHLTGAIVSKSPRVLMGRLAVLHLWNNKNQSTLYRRLRISGVKFNTAANTWDISFDDAMTLLDRPICVGLANERVTSVATNSAGNFVLTLATAASRDWASSATLESQCMISDDEGNGVIGKVQTAGASSVTVHYAPAFRMLNEVIGVSGTSPGEFAETETLSVKRCYVFRGSPMVALLQIMTSILGDGTNGTYDVLWGHTSDATGATRPLVDWEIEARFGAGISQELLDTSTLTNAELLSESPAGWCLVLHEEMNLLQVIEEVGAALNVFFFWNSDGKFSCKRLSGVYPTTTIAATLTEDHITRDSPLDVVDDEREAATAFSVKANYDVFQKQYMTTINVYHPLQHEVYREIGKVIKVERRGLVVGVPGTNASQINGNMQNQLPANLEDVAGGLYRVYARRMDGLRKYRIKLPWRFHTIVPGDVVSVTHEALSDFAGSYLSGTKLEIVSSGSLDLRNGTVEFEAHETWTGKLISPTGKVSSWVAGTKTITLAASAKYGGSTTPGNYFAAGWVVRVCDYSSSPRFSTVSSPHTISSVTATTIVLATSPSFTPAAGDIVMQASYTNATNTTTNSAQTLAQRGYAFMGGSTYRLGSEDADVWA